MYQKKKKPFAVKPTLFAACVELTEGSAVAGGMLCQASLLTEHGSLTDEKGKGGWIALSSQQWRVLTGYTRHQYNQALKFLKDKELVEHRRRKLNFKSKAALVWVRATDNTKFKIAEIMQRDSIPAFPDLSSVCETMENGFDVSAFSDSADKLDNNEITKNENSSVNVIGEVTKIKSAGKQYQSKKQAEKSMSKRARYNQLMKEVYKDYPHLVHDTYNEQSAKVLDEAKAYIESNPGNFLESCPKDKTDYAYVLGKVFSEWETFAFFVEYMYTAYNIPNAPQLWFLRYHMEAIPEFLNFLNMRRLFEEKVNGLGVNPDKYNTGWCGNMAEFIQYRKLDNSGREKFLNGKLSPILHEIEQDKKLKSLSS